MNRTVLYSAIASIGMLSAAGTTQAVQVSPDGRGQVLLYPYFTTRADSFGNAYATLVSVVNSTPSAKAVRVRFLEGKNSRSVLDLNLFLSPFDVWTAAVLPDTSTGGAKVGTLDLSCTLPAFSSSPNAPFISFVNFAYTGVNDDGAGTGLDRTKEGHFEIIEMATYTSSSLTGKVVTHVNGVPFCNAPLVGVDVQAAADAQAPTGGLFGAGTLINVNSGTDYSFDATALANFNQTGPNYSATGTSLPNLTQASPPVSSVFTSDGILYESAWASGTADPVSAVLMHDHVMNEYVLDTATRSTTDWVVTTPTKRYYTAMGTGNATKLFQRNFNGTAGSCDDLQLDSRDPRPFIYDREERTPQPGGLIGLPPPFIPVVLCWGASVITFNSNLVTSTLFGSHNLSSVVSPVGFQNGWMNIEVPTVVSGARPDLHKLPNSATSVSGRGQPTTTGNTVTYVGLPVIGFAAMSFTNGTLVVGSQTVLSNYGGSFVHKTSTLIQ